MNVIATISSAGTPCVNNHLILSDKHLVFPEAAVAITVTNIGYTGNTLVADIQSAISDFFATKVGVGPGRACITKLKTGFGTGGWQLAALRMCSKVASKPLIADGGIRHNGDIAKSVRFGATMVMIGSMLAGHQESPGNVIKIDGKTYKQYWGSASEVQKGAYRNVEGKQMLVPFRGSIKDTLREMQEDLQSSISYAGGRDLNSIKLVDYVIVKDNIFDGDR